MEVNHFIAEGHCSFLWEEHDRGYHDIEVVHFFRGRCASPQQQQVHLLIGNCIYPLAGVSRGNLGGFNVASVTYPRSRPP